MQSSAVAESLTAFRFQLARLLVVISFVWPFININHFFPQSDVEINFLPVFVASMMMPEVLAADGIALTLLAATLGVSVLWGSENAVLRVVIAAVPCLFLLNFHQYCLRRGRDLIPCSIAYRGLQLFVAFSFLQWFSFYIFSVIPGWLTEALSTIVPRYSGEPYDEFGVRGVQGWASEPAAGAMMCLSFAVVAAQQNPKRHLPTLVLLALLLPVNKSVYAIGLLAMWGLVYLFSLRSKWYAITGLSLLSLTLFVFISTSSRIEDFLTSAVIYGIEPESNFQLFRINQIIYPLTFFPRIYKPIWLFDRYIEPIGLLPVLLGYGSVAGLAFYGRLAFFKFPLRRVNSVLLVFTTLFVLSFLVPPDLVPAIVGFAYALTPTSEVAPRITWYEKLIRKAQQAYAT